MSNYPDVDSGLNFKFSFLDIFPILPQSTKRCKLTENYRSVCGNKTKAISPAIPKIAMTKM